jgi:hypothetical protein
MMSDLTNIEEEDERKPAARPTANNVKNLSTQSISSQQLRLMDHDLNAPPNRAIDDDDHDDNDDVDNMVQALAGEIPFLIMHWLNGYSRTGATNHDAEDDSLRTSQNTASSQLSTEARNAAMRQIQKATSDLALAFQTLGAFGTTQKVCIVAPNHNCLFIECSVIDAD